MSRIEMARAMCAQAEEYLKQARQQVQNGTLISQAIDLYQEVLAMEEVQIADPYLGIALLAFSQGDKAKAMGLMLTAKRLSPMNMRVNTLMQRLEKALVPAPPQQLHRVNAIRATTQDDERDWEQLQAQMAQVAESVGELQSTSEEHHRIQRLSLELGPPRTPGKSSHGAEVEFLQTTLHQLGFKVTRSGVFDPPTQLAIKTFQINQKLPMTGMVDAKTRTALNHLLDVTDAAAPLQEDFEQLVERYEEEVSQTFTDTTFKHIQDLWLRLIQIPQSPLWNKKRLPQEQLYFPIRVAQERHFEQPLGQTDGTHPGTEVQARQHNSLSRLVAGLSAIVHGFQQQQHLPVNEALLQQMEHLLEQIQEAILPQQKTSIAEPVPTRLVSVLGPAAGTGSLQRVSQGAEVILLQKLLQQKGFTLTESGTFDAATTAAVRNLQLKLKLPMTGWVDAPLREILNQAL